MYAKNALVVDDSRTARAILKKRLNQLDVVVESATDGSHALELLRHHTPDVIFLDHVMPGLDGFQVLERLKTHHVTRDIPVVMYTSQAAPMYTKEAKALGAVAVIPKEVSDEQLADALDRAELYQLTAANDDAYSPPPQIDAHSPVQQIAAANDADGALPRPLPAITGAGKADLPFLIIDSNQEERVSSAGESDARDPDDLLAYRRSLAQSGSWMTRGRAFAAIIAILMAAQMITVQRVSTQSELILDLHSQLLQQQQRLPVLEAQLREQQQALRLETSRQLEFLADILSEQIQHVAAPELLDEDPRVAQASAEANAKGESTP
ncbi:MAG: response regulator [Pseudomonadota bacterium]